MRFLKFYSPTCAPCRELNKVLDSLGISTVDVNVATDHGYRSYTNYRVKSVPTVVVVNQNNEEVRRVEGLKSPEELSALLGAFM